MNADIHGLSGAYAVDALDDVERAEFERHLAQCPECQAEVEPPRRRRRATRGTATPPSATLRASVWGRSAPSAPCRQPACSDAGHD